MKNIISFEKFFENISNTDVNDNCELIVGNYYHIHNGYAEDLDDIWINNCELISIENENAEVILYTFKDENGKIFSIDSNTLFSYNKMNKKRCYMFIDVY